MHRLIIMACLSIYVTSLPTRNERGDTDKIAGLADPKVEVSVAKTKDGLPKIVVDITERATDENKEESLLENNEALVAENRGIPEDKAEEKKGAPRSTIHVHSSNPPNINLLPQKYQINNMQLTPYGSKPGQGSGNHQGQYDNKRRKDEKPYNQVNVYVYFPNDMAGVEENSMTVNSYSSDGSSATYTNAKGQNVQEVKVPVEPCPLGYARIKGVCLEIDHRRKKMV